MGADAFIGCAIKDQAWVTNLCAKNDDGKRQPRFRKGSPIGLTLRALWVKASDTKHDATIAVTLDGQAATALADRSTLASGDMVFAPFEQRVTSRRKALLRAKKHGALLRERTASSLTEKTQAKKFPWAMRQTSSC